MHNHRVPHDCGGVQNRDRLSWLLRVGQAKAESKREQTEKKFHFHPPTYAANRESETGLIDQPLLNSFVGVHSSIAQEWPVRAMLINSLPFHFGRHDFFAIDRSLLKNFPTGRPDKTLAPELHTL